MKKIYIILIVSIIMPFTAFSQCTPVNCLSTLPAYGGLCDTVITDGRVNEPYFDIISFHVTNACVDAGLLDPSQAGVGVRITSIHSFVFAGLPNGITGITNQTTYTPNANGCGAFTGIPTEAGVFMGTASFMANVNAWPFSASCGGLFPPIPQNDNPLTGDLFVTILPDPTFTLPDSTFCEEDPDVTITLLGTLGGTLSGNGVTGNVFSPTLAGVGTHTITYLVSAQEGTAIAPATDSFVMTVEVTAAVDSFYIDADGDGFGDPNFGIVACDQPLGYVTNYLDCDDTDPNINPNAIDIPNNGIDENCDGVDSTTVGLAYINSLSMKVYPNPGRDQLTIEISDPVKETVQLEFISVYGQVVLRSEIEAGKEIFVTNTSELSSGIYLISVKNGDQQYLLRWVKY